MDEQAVRSLGHAVISELAPAELMLFEPVSRAFFEDPSRARAPSGGDEVLGFGLLEEATFLTPVVLAAARDIALFLGTEIAHALGKTAADEVALQLRRLVHREPAELRLSAAQLGRVRAIALDTAHRFKLPDSKAALMADALVGQLAAS